MPSLFFIVGRGRSGTTLLARMLSQHPDIVVAPEAMFALNLQRTYGSRSWSRRRVRAFCRDLLRDERMRDWSLDIERLAQRLRERMESLTYSRVCLEVYRAYAEQARGRTPKWVGDKNPHYALFLPRLQRLFPGARYIYVTRDYRDNIASYVEVPFDVRNPSALAQRWKVYNERILRFSRDSPERFLWLRYEDLVAQPEQELTRVCRFLGLSFDPGMLAFPASGKPHGVRAPLDASTVHRWRTELGERTVRRADAICGELAERFGYHPTTLGERPLSMPARAGVLYGNATVLIEKVVLQALPTRLRIAAINGYGAFTGRI
jgi:hypothetical protein